MSSNVSSVASSRTPSPEPIFHDEEKVAAIVIRPVVDARPHVINPVGEAVVQDGKEADSRPGSPEPGHDQQIPPENWAALVAMGNIRRGHLQVRVANADGDAAVALAAFQALQRHIANAVLPDAGAAPADDADADDEVGGLMVDDRVPDMDSDSDDEPPAAPPGSLSASRAHSPH